MLEDLRGQVALVTGGARGIGLAAATALADLGVDVVLADLLPQVERSATELAERTGVRTSSVVVDVTDPSSVADAVAAAEAALGTPTVLVNSAGIARTVDALDTTPEQWRRVVGVNLDGTFFVCQAFARALAAAGRTGTIVNVASMSGRIVNVPQNQAAYNASKSAVEALTKSLAVEWLPLGIRVNAVSPGYVLTDMTREIVDAEPDLAAIWRSRIPSGDLGRPEDVAALIAFLASDASRYVVGQSVVVDGGYTIV